MLIFFFNEKYIECVVTINFLPKFNIQTRTVINFPRFGPQFPRTPESYYLAQLFVFVVEMVSNRGVLELEKNINIC